VTLYQPSQNGGNGQSRDVNITLLEDKGEPSRPWANRRHRKKVQGKSFLSMRPRQSNFWNEIKW